MRMQRRAAASHASAEQRPMVHAVTLTIRPADLALAAALAAAALLGPALCVVAIWWWLRGQGIR